MERTLVLVKPDAVEKRAIGHTIARLEDEGLRIVALKMVFLSREEGAAFYRVHQDKPFYDSLSRFIASGPIVAMVLEGKEAISRVRRLMGATDPSKAEEGTIRRQMGTNVERNAVHGSDSPASASTEIAFFFSAMEVCDYEEDKGLKG
jgi:nucleoside-diphosphate kinase